jgi:hypothetical protein
MKIGSSIKFNLRWVKNLTIAILFLLNGCVEPYLPTTIVSDYDYLVVDGFLIGNDSTHIKLSRTQTVGDPIAGEGERNALVEVQAEHGNRYRLLEMENGLYVAPPLDLYASEKYRIYIQTDDSHEYYSDYVALKPSPSVDSVTWEQNLDGDFVQFNIFSHDPQNNTHYYLWTYDETFKYTSVDYSVYYYENGMMVPRLSSDEIYNCWKTNNNNNIFLYTSTSLAEDVVHDYELLRIPQYSRKLYFGYSILVKQYALTEEAYDYWLLTKSNSENLGTMFDPMPSQALGNIKCISNPAELVIGYFTATSVEKKRVFINRGNLAGPTTRLYDPLEPCPLQIFPLEGISAQSLVGKLVGDRIYDPITLELLGYEVYPAECVDCRLKGGVLQKPDYWE